MCSAEQCPETGIVNLAVALGYGVRTNPLSFSDDRNLFLIPDIAWYGENWYLDNLEVGYQWSYNSSFAFETFVTLNTSNLHFQDDHGSSFLLDSEFATGVGLPGDDTEFDIPPTTENPALPAILALSPDDVQDRDFAVDVGVRAHWYTDHSEWTLALLHDISDIYGGARAVVSYSKPWSLGSWKLLSSAELEWRSADLLDYYYGVDNRDLADPRYHYTPGSGLFTRIKLTASRPISANWRWLLHFSYNRLPSAMTDSPLVAKDYTITTFAGVTYQF